MSVSETVLASDGLREEEPTEEAAAHAEEDPNIAHQAKAERDRNVEGDDRTKAGNRTSRGVGAGFLGADVGYKRAGYNLSASEVL